MKLIPLLLALACGPALAQNPELQRCRAITDKDQRVNCYDALAARDAEGKLAAVAATAAVSGQAKADTFGLQIQRKDEPDVVDSQINGQVDGWGPNSVIRLANGQAWQVRDDSSVVLNLKSPKVHIRRGALGTFILELEGTNQTAKVRRLPS